MNTVVHFIDINSDSWENEETNKDILSYFFLFSYWNSMQENFNVVINKKLFSSFIFWFVFVLKWHLLWLPRNSLCRADWAQTQRYLASKGMGYNCLAEISSMLFLDQFYYRHWYHIDILIIYRIKILIIYRIKIYLY